MAEISVDEYDFISDETSVSARFTLVIVLPSPGAALVTRMLFGNPPSGPTPVRLARSRRYASHADAGSGSRPLR